MRNEIGKWFMDVAKYVATAVLISSFLGSFDDKKNGLYCRCYYCWALFY